MDAKTKKEFIQVFNEGFEQVVLPVIESLQETTESLEKKTGSLEGKIESLQENMEKGFRSLRNDVITKMDEVYGEVKNIT